MSIRQLSRVYHRAPVWPDSVLILGLSADLLQVEDSGARFNNSRLSCVYSEVKQSAHVAGGSASVMWLCRLSQPARHAASVSSRTIMKKQPSVGAAAEADLSSVHRAFLPRLTESTANRWIKATTQLFLSLNGEENGTCSSPGTQPSPSRL